MKKLLISETINFSGAAEASGHKPVVKTLAERMILDPQLGDIRSPVLGDFLQIWQRLRREYERPQQNDFSLTVFAEHLPYMCLCDLDPKTGRYLVKLFGSGYVDGVGADMTNRFVDEIPNTEDLLDRFEWLVHSERPYLLLDTQLVWSPKDYKTYHTMACPLFDNRGKVASVLFRIEFLE